MLLHWLVAAGIAFLYVHGFDMMRHAGGGAPGQAQPAPIGGILVFALVLVRIWWRITHPPPLVPMPKVQAWIAHYVHILIYVLLVVNGIAGSVGWIASGDPVVLFGVQLAPERTPSPALNHLCIQVGLTTVAHPRGGDRPPRPRGRQARMARSRPAAGAHGARSADPAAATAEGHRATDPRMAETAT
jgi:cytochrome b561